MIKRTAFLYGTPYRDREIYSFSEVSELDLSRLSTLPDVSRVLDAYPKTPFYRFFLKKVSYTGKAYFRETGLAFFIEEDKTLVRTDTGEVLRGNYFLALPSRVIVYGPTKGNARRETGLDETLIPLRGNDLSEGEDD